MNEQPDTTRLNGKVERQMDSLALVVCLYNDSAIAVPKEISETLDEIGHFLLHHYKTTRGITSEQTQQAVIEISAKMQARVDLLKQGAANVQGA